MRRTLAAFLGAIVFFSCKYGLPQFELDGEPVDSRAKSIKTINPPDVGSNSRYSFILISDPHFGASDKRYDQEFLNLFQSLLASNDEGLRPKFLICLGDTLNGGRTREANDFNEFCNKMRKAAKEAGLSEFQAYAILGNHDLYNEGWEVWKREIYPYTSYYKFSLGTFTYYFLDTGNGALGQPQLEDMKKHLKSDKSPKIVFSHYAIYTGGVVYYTLQNTMERNLLLSALANSNVKAIFSGHAHREASFDFKDLFYSNIIPSYLSNRKFMLVSVDESEKSVSCQMMEF